jgi:hypothetical protein
MKISPDDGTIVHGCVDPCPLCGDNAYLHSDGGTRSRPRFWVKCDNIDCGCTLNSDTHTRARF